VTDAPSPWLDVTPKVMGKMALSTMLMAVGMYYLASGRKQAELSRMLTGAALAVASVFVFIL